MDDVQEIRRAKLALWLEQEDGAAAVSKKYGLSISYLSQILSGYSFGEKAARNMERKARLPVNYFDVAPGVKEPAARYVLAKEEETPVQSSGRQETGIGPSSPVSVEPGPRIMGRVPLVSWAQAGDLTKVAAAIQNITPESSFPCPAESGPFTYCVKVRGISMENPSGRPSYSDGDVIFVDPGRTARSLDRVIVRRGSEDARFKQLIVEGGRRYLKSLNPAWPDPIEEMTEDMVIAGVIIGKWVPE